MSGPWRAYLFEPARDNPRRRGIEADGTYYATVGGVRVRVRPGTYSWSPDVVLGGIAATSRVRQGWLFAGRDGALYRAAYFTAPLERVGSTEGAPLEQTFISDGRLSAADSNGQLWIGSNEGFRRWNAPEGSVLLDAGFVNESFGVALVSPGRLFRSNDGGARWDAVELRDRGVFEVLPDSDGFVLRAPDGLLRAEASGAPSSFSGIALPSDVSVPDANAVRAAAVSEGPGARAAQLAQGAIVLPPDRVYHVTGYRAPTDRFGAYVRPQGYSNDELWITIAGQAPTRLDSPGSQCRFFPWRERIFAFCRDATSGYRAALFAGDGLSNWTSITPPTSINLWGAFGSSSDGRTLWTFSGCDSSARTSNILWCRYEGGRWNNVEVERRATFVAAWGDHVVYRITQGVFEQSVPGPLRMQSVSATPEQARPPRRSDPRARIETGAFTQDGTFFARATIEDTVVLAIGSIDQELTIRALPDGAKDVSMADRNRGLAVGERLDRVWSTEDGGRTWRPLTLPLHGDSQGILINAESGDSEVRVRCTANACVIADRLVWTSEALIGEPPPAVHSAPRVQPAELPNETAVRPRPPSRAIEFGTVRCAVDVPSNVEDHYFNAGAWVHARSNAWEWGGHDGRAAFRASTRGLMPAQDTAPNWTGSVLTYSPRFASRSLAIVERCSFLTTYGGGSRAKQCDLVALTPNQPPRVWLNLRAVAAPLSAGTTTPRIAELAALPDGTFAVRVASGPLDDGPGSSPSFGSADVRADLLLRITAAGVIAEQKSFAWARNETRMRALAFDGQHLGVIVLRRDTRELRFFASPTDSGRALAPAPLRVQPCGTEPSARAPFFVTSANDHNAAIRAGAALSGQGLFRGEDSVQTTVEMGSSGVCIRRITAGTGTHSSITNTYASAQLGGALVLDAVNGALRATAVQPGRRVAADCVPDVVNR